MIQFLTDCPINSGPKDGPAPHFERLSNHFETKQNPLMYANTNLMQSCLILFALGWTTQLQAQPRFNELPGYDRFSKVESFPSRIAPGGKIVDLKWSHDFKKFNFTASSSGTRKTFDLKAGKIIDLQEITPFKAAPIADSNRRRSTRVPRATQRPIEISNSEKWTAVYDNFNVKLKPADPNSVEIQVTTNGQDRLRYGTGCWVYGEELDQDSAMWWSPSDQHLAFYEIDERHMRDYHLTINNTRLYTDLQTVRYPKAGDPNPFAAILIYDLTTRSTVKADIPGEKSQYVYNVRWTPDGSELLVNRTNRHQNELDVFAVDPNSGKSRIVLSERQKNFQTNSPKMMFLKDGKTFIWETEKNGWKNFELRNLNGKLVNPLTSASGYPADRIYKLDETAGWFYYTAYSAENPYNLQLHRCRLNGTQNRRLTANGLHHVSFTLSPDHNWLIGTCEDINTPPRTILYDRTGKEISVLDQAHVAQSIKHPLNAEIFSFLAADGKTKIYGTLHKPTNFDPKLKYPLLVDVYGGPHSKGLSNRFRPVNAYCEFGFCIAKFGNRGTVDRGKEFEDATYLKLGAIDLQDQVDGVKHLSKRAYIDGDRVGIYGHSYGGYLAALAVLKFPEVFHVAVSGAPVTTWKNYDTIYTERYMRTPLENPDGYRIGSCMQYAKNLKGKLLMVHGLIDDNVHPSNTWQLVEALHAADRRFDMQIYPKFKHGIGSTYMKIRWEYLCRHLQLAPGS